MRNTLIGYIFRLILSAVVVTSVGNYDFTRQVYVGYYSGVDLRQNMAQTGKKLQEMVLQWFLVLRDVENNLQKVYQNPLI